MHETKPPSGEPKSGCASDANTVSARKWTSHPAALAGLLLLMVFVAYLPALRCGYIWDDDEYVTNNPLLTKAHGLHDIWFSTQAQSQYFPLVYTTFKYERVLWGLNLLGYHLVNILLHGLNAVLVWLVLKRLLIPGAWLAAALFALHPVQVETVAWVSELKNIESLLFYLLALLAWIKFTDQSGKFAWLYYGLAFAAALLALFAKTTACTLPAAMVLVLWLRGQRVGWRRAAQILPFVTAGLGMGLLTIWWEKNLGDYQEPFALAFTWLERGLIATHALWFYAGKLIWPVDLTICYPQWRINASNPAQYIPWAACLIVGLLLWTGRKKIGRGVIAGIVFFVAALSPMLGFIVEGTFHYTYVADHYQYNATIGLLAILAALLWRALAKTGFWLPLQAVLLLTLGCLTWRQCAPYRDQESLWRDNLAKNPDSYVGHLNLGIELFKQRRLDEALEQDQAAVALHPGGDHEQANLGTVLVEKGQYGEAIQHLESALTINPKYADAENSLGLAYFRMGEDDQAIAHYQKALQIKPDSLGIMMNLGSVLKREGRLNDAAQNYRAAAKQFPTEAEPLHRLAGILIQQEQYAPALAVCQKAIKLAPQRADLLLDLGNMYMSQTNYVSAGDYYQQALKLQPDNAGLHYNLGVVRGLEGQPDKERHELEEALRLDPNFSPAQQQLLLLNIRQTN